MITIKDIRKRCQDSRKETDAWYGWHFARKISAYITFLFLILGIRACAATAIFLASGLGAGIVFSFGGRVSNLIGALTLQLWYILDHVDGEVARYNNETSLTGIYFDKLVHYIVHPLVFFGLGWGIFQVTKNTVYIVNGLAGGLSVILLDLIIDLKRLIVSGGLKDTFLNRPSQDIVDLHRPAKQHGSLPKSIFSRFYSFCHFSFIMNVIMASAVIDFLFNTLTIAFVLRFYTILLSIAWISRATVFIIERRVDKEFIDVKK